MAIVETVKVGDVFTGTYQSSTRKFRAFVKNIDVTTSNGVARVTVGSAGLRKTEGGNTEVQTGGNPTMKVTFNGSSKTKTTSNSIYLNGDPPVDRNIVTSTDNWYWDVAQTASDQVLTMTFKYSKSSSTAWGGSSSGSFSITIPASGSSSSSVALTNIQAVRSGSYVVTTFTVTGDYTVNSAYVTLNGSTYSASRSGNDFTSYIYYSDTTSAVSISVNVNVTPTGGTATALSGGTFISGDSVAVDFYSPTYNNYNVGIGTTAYGSYWGSSGRVDINGALYINGVEYSGGGGGGSSVPSGTITMFGGITAPDGWLICNGQSVSSATYPLLYLAIGTRYGGNSSYFNVPDLEFKFPLGADPYDADYIAGKTGGTPAVTLTTSEMPSHQHTTPSHQHSISLTTGSGGSHTHLGYYKQITTGTAGTAVKPSFSSAYGSAGSNDITQSAGGHTHTVNGTASGGSATTGSSGSGNAHNNMPPYLCLTFIIKT